MAVLRCYKAQRAAVSRGDPSPETPACSTLVSYGEPARRVTNDSRETKEAGAKVGYIVPPPAQKRKNGVPIKSGALTSSLTLSSASSRVSGFPSPLLGPKQSQLPRRDLSAKKYKPSVPLLATICQSGATSSSHGPLRQNPPTREESCGHATPSFTHPTV